jgi:exoribonuclease II
MPSRSCEYWRKFKKMKTYIINFDVPHTTTIKARSKKEAKEIFENGDWIINDEGYKEQRGILFEIKFKPMINSGLLEEW